MSDEERVNANENVGFKKKGGREGRSGGPRLHAKVSLAFSCDGLTRLEATALHTGDPGKWNVQINKTTTALYSTRRGGYVAALC